MEKKTNYLQRFNKIIESNWTANVSAADLSTPTNRMRRTPETLTVVRCRNGGDHCRTSPVAPSCTWIRLPPAIGKSSSTVSWRRWTGDSPRPRTGRGTSRNCFQTRSRHRGRYPRAWLLCTRYSPWTWRSWSRFGRRQLTSAAAVARFRYRCPARTSCAYVRVQTARTNPDSIPENHDYG